MKRILLSLLTISLVIGASMSATLAFFTDTDTLATTVTVAGDLELDAVVTNAEGSTGFDLFAQDLTPGTSDVRCLWIENESEEVAGRFKLYRTGPDTGNGAVGDNTFLSFVLNPSSGDCSTTTLPSDITANNKYGANDYAETNWGSVQLRSGSFDDPNNTPVRFLNTYTALAPDTYLVFRVTSTLSGSADSSLAGQVYNTPVTLFGIQKEGSDADNLW